MSSAQAAVAKKSAGVMQRIITPVVNMAHKVEHRSATKLQGADAAIAASIKSAEATGADAATLSRQRFLHEQRQLLSYRVVRCFEETRYIVSGQYFKHYNFGCFLQDARFLTQALFVFLIAVLAGRRSIFPPIHPDSPLAIALDHKVNPNY